MKGQQLEEADRLPAVLHRHDLRGAASVDAVAWDHLLYGLVRHRVRRHGHDRLSIPDGCLA